MSISAKKVKDELFNYDELSILTKDRLKALRRSIYKNVSTYFHCCEFCCDLNLDTELKKNQYNTYLENLKRVNSLYYKK